MLQQQVTRRQRWRRQWRRTVLTRRRPLAALLVVVAVLAALRSLAPPPPETVPVIVAAHDLPGGTALGAGDLAEVALPPDAVPARALERSDLVGRTLAAPVARGEPLTSVRVLGEGLHSSYPGRTTMPVRLPDGDGAGLLRAGDRVDLLATDPETASSVVLTREAVVVTVPEAGSAGELPGRLVVLAVWPGDVTRVASATAREWIGFAYTS